MIKLLLNNILRFHEQLDAAKGIRDLGLIESAVNAPFQTFGGRSLYPSVLDKAARLGFGLTENHGFIDGNKRVALHAMELYLRLNLYRLDCSQGDRVAVMLKIARGEFSAEWLKLWLASRVIITPSIFASGITIKI